MRGPLIESPTTPSRTSRRFVTILALGVGIVGANALPDGGPGAGGAGRRADHDDARPRPGARRADGDDARARATARPPQRVTTSPVHGPLDFVGDPLPDLKLPPWPEPKPVPTLKLGDDVVEPWKDPEPTDDGADRRGRPGADGGDEPPR